MKIIIGTTNFFEIQREIITFLKNKGYDAIDINENKEYDIFDISVKAAKLVSDKKIDRAIIIDDYAQDSFIITSKFKHNVVAPVYEDYTAELTTEHNNTNIICLGGKLLAPEYMKSLIETFLDSTFEAGRHLVRTDMLEELLIKEENNCSKKDSNSCGKDGTC